VRCGGCALRRAAEVTLRMPAKSALFAAMSTSILPPDPVQIRPLLHAEIDRLGDENLMLMHRIAMELELEEVTARLNEGFDADRAAGKLERLPEIIREARAAIRARAGQ
jgi:hypothetical protein